MKILVLNSGSSSIKYKLFDINTRTALVEGIADRIGEQVSSIKHKAYLSDGSVKKTNVDGHLPDHQSGLTKIADLLFDAEVGVVKSADEISAVGHRVVHGAEKFSKPVVVNVDILEVLHKLSHLAPLHNPANLKGIEVASQVFPQAKQIAVFDTAFHQSMPNHAFRYAIPETYYKEDGLRVYGFHGTSHQFVSKSAAGYLGIPLNKFNAISIHLGNGCSMSAIKGGQSIDTSMGLTPLGGLIMGTRSGDIDPSLILLLGKNHNLTFDEVDLLLNKDSGLKGLTGNNDFRDVIAKYDQKDPDAILAIEMYAYRIRKYIGAYAVALGRVDAIIFTAGVGENSVLIREKVCKGLEIINAQLDSSKNENIDEGIAEIQTEDSDIKLLVVPTNEELEIADQASHLLNSM
ncbi:MAG: acetate kinase [Cyclobacteriaceae bacterium]